MIRRKTSTLCTLAALGLFAVSVFSAGAAAGREYDIMALPGPAEPTVLNQYPDINGSHDVVWSGLYADDERNSWDDIVRCRIFRYKDGTTTEVTGDREYWRPRINNAGMIGWHVYQNGLQIYDGSVRTITSNPISYFEWQMNDRGEVVWNDYGEIYLRAYGGGTVRLSEDDNNGNPSINNGGDVVWSGTAMDGVGQGREQVFFRHGDEREQLTFNTDADNTSACINAHDDIAWVRKTGSSHEVWLKSDGQTLRISTESDVDGIQFLSIAGQERAICWSQERQGIHEIVLWRGQDGDGGRRVSLTNGSGFSLHPRIGEWGDVVWARDGDVYVYDYVDQETTRLTDDEHTDQEPQVSSNGHVVWEKHVEGEYRIMYAEPVVELPPGTCPPSSTLGGRVPSFSLNTVSPYLYLIIPMGLIVALRARLRSRSGA